MNSWASEAPLPSTDLYRPGEATEPLKAMPIRWYIEPIISVDVHSVHSHALRNQLAQTFRQVPPKGGLHKAWQRHGAGSIELCNSVWKHQDQRHGLALPLAAASEGSELGAYALVHRLLEVEALVIISTAHTSSAGACAAVYASQECGDHFWA